MDAPLRGRSGPLWAATAVAAVLVIVSAYLTETMEVLWYQAVEAGRLPITSGEVDEQSMLPGAVAFSFVAIFIVDFALAVSVPRGSVRRVIMLIRATAAVAALILGLLVLVLVLDLGGDPWTQLLYGSWYVPLCAGSIALHSVLVLWGAVARPVKRTTIATLATQG